MNPYFADKTTDELYALAAKLRAKRAPILAIKRHFWSAKEKQFIRDSAYELLAINTEINDRITQPKLL